MNEDHITGQRAGSITREQRIEAAARAMQHRDEFSHLGSTPFDDEPEGVQDEWRVQAAWALKHAFPEIMSDPPTGWVAPWNATETIRDTIWGAVIPLPEDSQEAAEIDVWADVRDAHTKEQT